MLAPLKPDASIEFGGILALVQYRDDRRSATFPQDEIDGVRESVKECAPHTGPHFRELKRQCGDAGHHPIDLTCEVRSESRSFAFVPMSRAPNIRSGKPTDDGQRHRCRLSSFDSNSARNASQLMPSSGSHSKSASR